MPPSNTIYLDCAATTPLLPEIADVFLAGSRDFPANPASQHRAARAARAALEQAREELAALLGCLVTGRAPDRVIYTSGGTEANNLALLGLTAGQPPGRVVVSAIEHPSILETAKALRTEGWRVDHWPVTSAGQVDLTRIESILDDAPPPRLVSVMLGNNETGALQPVREIAAACRARGILVHTDAVQAVGKVPVHFRELDVDLLSLAGHKFHAPRGVGALIARDAVPLVPQLYGGFQQAGIRPGTETVALPLAMTAALRLAQDNLAARTAHLVSLQHQLESGLRQIYPAVEFIAADGLRLPHITNAALVGIDRQALLLALDLAGVAVSTGSACASGSSEPSPVLLAMDLPRALVDSSLRFSWGGTTSAFEISDALVRMKGVLGRIC
ncbi:MAG: cysteine desulfurase family protein [Pirellulales bacterium]|nr:cysteine desulfurase family protein [Pirellulales bacterium]